MAIHVGVYKPPDRANYQLVWTDPKTGKQRRRSSGERRRREAEERARQLQRELNAAIDDRSWPAFLVKYKAEHLASLAENTRKDYASVLAQFTRVVDPERVRDVDASTLSTYAAHLRDEGRTPDTIAKHLRTISAALQKAELWKIIAVAPRPTKPKRAKGGRKMKGRPLRLEEFERMLKVTPSVVGKSRAREWRRLLRGLWLSGFRLSEALAFWWDDPSRLCVWDLSARRPTMVIHAELEKGNRDRPYFPLTPDFATWLRRIPESERVGPVFSPRLRRGGRVTRSEQTIGRTISAIGKAAGVVVARSAKPSESDVRRTKYASAHDLRRTFGSRWAMMVKPAVLKELMRHQTIDTTMDYYVELDGEELADAIWSGWSTANNAGRDSTFGRFHGHPTESDVRSTPQESP